MSYLLAVLRADHLNLTMLAGKVRHSVHSLTHSLISLSFFFFGSPTFNEGYNIQRWRVRLSPESAYMFYKNIAHKFMGLTRV